MGLFRNEVERISASEVIYYLAYSNGVQFDHTLASAGQKQHKRIINALREQAQQSQLPGFADGTPQVLPIASGEVISRGKPFRIQAADHLQLSVKPDAIFRNDQEMLCLEIKSGFFDYHLLQLMYECMVTAEVLGTNGTGAIHGILYMYGDPVLGDTYMKMWGGGQPFWEYGKQLAIWAREIRAAQFGPDNPHIKQVVTVGDGIPVLNEDERMVIIYNYMRETWNYLSYGLRAALGGYQ